ncbi:3'-phosphoadenosine 5'-phosphosulfate sulfotransferase [Sporothrix epigloea]|uniref:FAD synthase n=1 Tax=Sporothrix epigloea TaxID=1892477 RepID=A0ABP0DYA2_9PEZI
MTRDGIPATDGPLPPSANDATYNNGGHQNGYNHGVPANSSTKEQAAAIAVEAETAPSSASSRPRSYTFPDVCYKLRHKVQAFLAEEIPASEELLRNVQSQVRASVDVIDQALRRYSLDQVSLSYNGGKDCLVLLILILACLPACNEPTGDETNSTAKATTIPAPQSPASTAAAVPTTPIETFSTTPSSPSRSFQAIYIVPPDLFPEVDEFVDQSTADYQLDLARYPMAMRAALDAYLTDRPAVQAIFMGTRRTDPHAEFLTHFTPTDPGWPQLMRIHPVINWHYAEIWAFIRHFDVPFCSLYNRGFTSLGGTSDTRPNPVLAKTGADITASDENGSSTPTSFRPAYELMDDDEERLGRGR